MIPLILNLALSSTTKNIKFIIPVFFKNHGLANGFPPTWGTKRTILKGLSNAFLVKEGWIHGAGPAGRIVGRWKVHPLVG
ncbi:MAG: hypothetical protein Q9174_004497 [Haloplaca sp. 1 TL-2023]